MQVPGLNFINSRLSLGARLAILSALFIAPTAMLLFMFTTQSWSNIAFARKEAAGAEYLAGIWSTYSTQATAADTAALAQLQARMDKTFETEGQSTAYANAKPGPDRLTAGRALIDAVSNASGLPLDPDADSLDLMLATTTSLPALGADLAAFEEALALPAGDPKRPTRVAETMQEMRSDAAEAHAQVTAAIKENPAVATAAQAKIDAFKAAASNLAGRRDALLAGAGADTAAADIAGLHAATDAAWRASESELHRLLKAREGKLLRSLITNLSIVLTALAIGGAMAMAIAKGMSGRISVLLKIMDRLIGGDTAVDVPHLDDRNETGRIAHTVGVFKQSLIDAAQLREERVQQSALADQERQAAEAERAATAKEQAKVVDDLALGLEKLSGGALTFRLNDVFAPAYEKLRADFNAAMTTMQDTMCEVAVNATGVRTGAGEISQASDNLSRRTEQQAASLEETAAALDEITATVRKTAEGASQARETVGAARTDAERSGVVVRDAVAAMSEIENSAQQISQIIGVIDEIAFQTNLLALNAGVEAARAGDAGRGFAVVASEVRALAQRSADAAKEIKTLISASSQQVDRGVSLVGETGKVLERILTQVTQINGVVTEIAASAQEQATGLQQVNTAVNQMDQVTQQNAAMVEEATAASHALASEAETLARLISRFDLGQTAHAPSAHARPHAAPAKKTIAALKTMAQRGAAAIATDPAVEAWDEF